LKRVNGTPRLIVGRGFLKYEDEGFEVKRPRRMI
jgi:hypothetical protein